MKIKNCLLILGILILFLAVNTVSAEEIGVDVEIVDDINYEPVKADNNIIVDVVDSHYGNLTIEVNVSTNETKNMTLNIDNKTFTSPIKNKSALFNLSYNITPGTYNVTFQWGNYSAETMIMVHKAIIKPGELEVIELSNIMGNTHIVIKVPKRATGNITITIDGHEEVYVSPIIDGNATFDFSTLDEGEYLLRISYSGDANYRYYSKDPIELELTLRDYGHGNVTIKITAPFDLTGYINFTMNNITYTAELIDGIAIFNFTNLKPGPYDVNITHPGDKNYAAFNGFATIPIPKYDSEINVTVINSTIGNASVKIDVPYDATGNITLTLNKTNYTGKIINGSVIFNLTHLELGKHNITIIYSGDDYYDIKEFVEEVIFYRLHGKINVTVLDDKIIVNITENATGNITLLINNTNITKEIVNGSVIFELDEGKYNITLIYSGDDYYEPIKYQNNIEVGIYILHTNDLTNFYGSASSFTVTLTNGNLKPRENKKIIINVNGKTYSKTTDKDGKATFNLYLKTGTYTIVTTVDGKNVTNNNTITVLTTITGKDIEKYFQNATQYQVKLVDSDGTPLTNSKVTININGKTYTKTTDKNGIATMNINLSPGNYTIIAINNVNGEKVTNNVKVYSLLVGGDLVKYYRNDSQYHVKLFNSHGKPYANQNIVFNIHGVFYNKITDENGIATLTINIQPGTYILTAIYGDAKISNTITVLSTIVSKNAHLNFGDKYTYKITVLDGKGNPAPYQRVTFNIHGVFYNKYSDSNGVVSLNINLMSGNYIITTYYGTLSVSNTITVLG